MGGSRSYDKPRRLVQVSRDLARRSSRKSLTEDTMASPAGGVDEELEDADLRCIGVAFDRPDAGLSVADLEQR